MHLLKMADMQQIDVIIKGINAARLGIPCAKMSLQWPDKLCNVILWIVLGEELGDPLSPQYTDLTYMRGTGPCGSMRIVFNSVIKS